jgi:hypothetical protein
VIVRSGSGANSKAIRTPVRSPGLTFFLMERSGCTGVHPARDPVVVGGDSKGSIVRDRRVEPDLGVAAEAAAVDRGSADLAEELRPFPMSGWLLM